MQDCMAILGQTLERLERLDESNRSDYAPSLMLAQITAAKVNVSRRTRIHRKSIAVGLQMPGWFRQLSLLPSVPLVCLRSAKTAKSVEIFAERQLNPIFCPILLLQSSSYLSPEHKHHGCHCHRRYPCPESNTGITAKTPRIRIDSHWLEVHLRNFQFLLLVTLLVMINSLELTPSCLTPSRLTIHAQLS